MGHLARDNTKALTTFVNQVTQNIVLNKPPIGQGASNRQGGGGREIIGLQAHVYALLVRRLRH